jgi:hypothetical protein
VLWKLSGPDRIADRWKLAIYVRVEHGCNHFDDQYGYSGDLYGDDH